eukprot:scaffold8733_cov191-Skeletonema_dohrnii-CCMP3373.AAC.4
MELCSMKLVRYEERFVVVFLLAAAWRVEVAAVQKKDSWFGVGLSRRLHTTEPSKIEKTETSRAV